MAGIFTIPKSQTLRFINKNKLSSTQNYDNRFAGRLKYANTSTYHYNQKLLQSDALWCQFRTNYPDVKAYLVDSDNNKTEITANLSLVYTDSSDRNYYNLTVDLSALTGCYFIELSSDSDIDKPSFIFQSEYFQVVEYWDNSILLEWDGNESYDDMMDWDHHSFTQFLRVSGSDRDITPEQNKTIYNNSDFAPITLKSKPIRNIYIYVDNSPIWIFEKINIALSHDHFYCNGVLCNSEDVIESNKKEKSHMREGGITVTQIDFEDGEDEEITGGTISQEYLMINDTDYLLINDSGDRLKIN